MLSWILGRASQKSSNVVPTPEGEEERGAAGARRTTLFLSFFSRRRRPVLAKQCDFRESLGLSEKYLL